MPAKQGSGVKKPERVFRHWQVNAKMVRAALYGRVSTQDQQTLPMQDRAMRELSIFSKALFSSALFLANPVSICPQSERSNLGPKAPGETRMGFHLPMLRLHSFENPTKCGEGAVLGRRGQEWGGRRRSRFQLD
jgi:hypothetical protein